MEHRDYSWSSIFAWGLTLSGAVLATGGVIGMFWPDLNLGWLCILAFAGMMAFGIGLVNCSAAGALHAIKHRKADGRQVDWTVLLPALACCLGFVFATNIGVHIGWEIVKSNAPAGAALPPTATIDVVFYIFAFAKPAMAWIVEGRKAMDAETRTATTIQRRKDAEKMADAETARAVAVASATSAPAAAVAAPESTAQLAAPAVTETAAPEVEAMAAPMADTGSRASRTRPKRKPKPELSDEDRARDAAIRAAARRAAEFRAPKVQARVHDIEEARRDQTLTPEQIARACDLIIKSGKTPNVRRVAEILAVSRDRVEKSWPKGVPLDGTGNIRAA